MKSSRRTFFLSKDEKFPPNNGAIETIATIIKAVMSSAAEAELGALFTNAKEAVYLRQILILIQTDNTTAEGVINNKIQPKRTKAMDMQFHWLRDREAQGQLKIYWWPGNTNHADYFTKHHPPGASCQCASRISHKNQRPGRSQTHQKCRNNRMAERQNRYTTRVC
jgi:hypothetical protein